MITLLCLCCADFAATPGVPKVRCCSSCDEGEEHYGSLSEIYPPPRFPSRHIYRPLEGPIYAEVCCAYRVLDSRGLLTRRLWAAAILAKRRRNRIVIGRALEAIPKGGVGWVAVAPGRLKGAKS